VPLVGRKHNRLNVLNMDLVVKRSDLPAAAALADEHGSAPPPGGVPLGFTPYQAAARPGMVATEAPPPVLPRSDPGPAPAPGGSAPPVAAPSPQPKTKAARTRWVPPPDAVPAADAPPPIGGLADLFKQPPAGSEGDRADD